MSKWQIICPVVAMVIVGVVLGLLDVRGERQGLLRVTVRSIGEDLITTTNSAHLVLLGPNLQVQLSELLSVRTHVADVILGDEPSPYGDGTASCRLVLRNDAGGGLFIRLRPAKQSGMFHVLGFRTVSE